MLPEYKVITADSVAKLNEQVNLALEVGYKPIGSATHSQIIGTIDGVIYYVYTQTLLLNLS